MTADTEGDMTLQYSKYWLIRADFQMESFRRKHVGFIRHEGHYKLSHDVSHWLLKSCRCTEADGVLNGTHRSCAWRQGAVGQVRIGKIWDH